MRVAEYPLQQLHWVIRQDPWVRAIFLAAGVKLDELAERILDISTSEDAEAMMSRSLALWEKLLGITPGAEDTVEQRRGAVRAMWLASLPPSVASCQAVCDAWRAGEAEAAYVPGSLLLWLTGGLVPEGFDRLIALLDRHKPAHLSYRYGIRPETDQAEARLFRVSSGVTAEAEVARHWLWPEVPQALPAGRLGLALPRFEASVRMPDD